MLLRSELLCSNINCDYTTLSRLSAKQWRDLVAFAHRHGVKYLLFEAISKLPKELQPDAELMLHWYVDTQKAEERYRRYTIAIEELSAFMSQADLPMMILKGYTIANLYPIPQRREGGDIDIFLLDGYQKGDDIVRKRGGKVRTVSKRSKHTQFLFRGINVDNHKSFVVDSEGLTPRLESFYGRIEEIIRDSVVSGDLNHITLRSQTIYALKPDVAALYLITHTFRHLVVAALSLRHCLDWMILFNHYRESLDRELLLSQIEVCELGCFVANVEAFCQERFLYTPFFDLQDRYSIYCGALSVESTVINFKQRKVANRLFGKIRNSLIKLYLSQRYYAAYLGMNSYCDYLIPNLISRIKQLWH